MPQFPTSRYSTCPANGAFVRAQGSHSPMVEPDLSPQIDQTFSADHPFKITKVSLSEVESGTTIVFKCSVGHVFGAKPRESANAWCIDQENDTAVRIDTDTITESPVATVSPEILDERNIGVNYVASLDSTQDNIIYVELSRASTADDWIPYLKIKTVTDAKADYDAAPLNMVKISEIRDNIEVEHLGGTYLGNTIVTVNLNGTLGNEFVLNLEGLSEQFTVESAYVGTAQIPVAYVRKVDTVWNIRQILRSDIFFPFGTTYKVTYIDTGIETFTGGSFC